MNPYGKKNIAGSVWELIEPVADSLGYRLWNVEYVREGADMYLRVTIDSDDGIGIDDCERMTRAIDPILDEAKIRRRLLLRQGPRRQFRAAIRRRVGLHC